MKNVNITIKEIAKKSGYGIGTVSRALSDNPSLVKNETRLKILKIAQEYGYVKNSNAQALVSGKTTDIGFVIPAVFGSPFYNDFSIKLISSILNAVSIYGYKLRVLFLKEKAGFNEIMKEVRSLNLKGLIICPYSQTFYIDEADIKKMGIPIVVLSKRVKGDNISSVILDDYRGGYDGTNFLLGLGHKKIAIIRGFRNDIEERYKGYLAAHKDAGIAVNKDLVLQGTGMELSGYEKTLELLNKGITPSAIFCLDDEMAIGAMRAIKEKKLKCPNDISILGFDGMEICNFTDPPLSTVNRPAVLMGQKAVDILLGSSPPKSSLCVKVKAQIVPRASCMAVKK